MSNEIKPKKLSDTKINTGEARVSFPHLIAPWAGAPGQDAKFSATLIFDPSDPTVAMLRELVKECARNRWGAKMPAGMRSPVSDGVERYPETVGKVVVKTTARTRPAVIDALKRPITDENELYGGMYGRAQVSAYSYDQSGNRGVALSLLALQKTRDGERFGGEAADVGAFDELTPETENDPFDI